jgi:hypothetical protein
MPKIDWVQDNDNQPRWEPRTRRERTSREARDRRARLEQIIAIASGAPPTPEQPIKRPLHLIWGAPVARPASQTEPEQT